jgi:hypothetical protein
MSEFVYGEYGLAGQLAIVWLYGETLTVAYADTPLTHYRVSYQPNGRHIRTLTEPELFATVYRSPQLSLWQLSEDEWQKAVPLPHRQPVTRRPQVSAWQELLLQV